MTERGIQKIKNNGRKLGAGEKKEPSTMCWNTEDGSLKMWRLFTLTVKCTAELNFDLQTLCTRFFAVCAAWLWTLCSYCSWSFICLMTIPQVQWTRRQDRMWGWAKPASKSSSPGKRSTYFPIIDKNKKKPALLALTMNPLKEIYSPDVHMQGKK